MQIRVCNFRVNNAEVPSVHSLLRAVACGARSLPMRIVSICVFNLASSVPHDGAAVPYGWPDATSHGNPLVLIVVNLAWTSRVFKTFTDSGLTSSCSSFARASSIRGTGLD